jgi:hypothetical protein
MDSGEDYEGFSILEHFLGLDRKQTSILSHIIVLRMYLSNRSVNKLDNVIKNFEVAYRSFVVYQIKNSFNNEAEFQKKLIEVSTLLQGNSILNSSRFKSKIQNILKDIKGQYNTIESCNKAIYSKSVPEKSKVPYVSTVIDYIEIFFEPYFKNSILLNGFQDKDFFDLSYLYHKIRNEISHPASSRISMDAAKEVIRFVEKVLLNLPDQFFWFSSKGEINKLIEEFLATLSKAPIPINNFNEITYTHKKLIQRNQELLKLKEWVFGKEGFEYYRKARSIIVYGYGGLGKTALVLEFINEVIKEATDSDNKSGLDFLLYFTAKEEELDYSSLKKQFQINEIRKQIQSFENFRTNLFTYLKISNDSELGKLKGLLIIDNIETLKDEKQKFIDFIKTLPDTIQVIITSREEEIAESKLHLQGYDHPESGRKFLTEYIEEYNLNFEYIPEYDRIIEASKGNTLILVLSLLRLNDDRNSLSEIIQELNSISSASISAVANFMYKNTFDQAIEEIEKKGWDSKKILSVVAYYNEPIDLYSLTKLSDLESISTTEKICDILLQKLVLSKKNEYFEINEFASKFIIVKIIPNKIEAQFLTNKISEFKFQRRKTLRTLEEDRTDAKLNNIMSDWAPRNNVEKIAIAEAYDLYSVAQGKKFVPKGKSRVQFVNEKFKELESISQHPYVRFQKARVFTFLLQQSFNKEYLEVITKSYEEAIFSIKFDYQYIIKTQSYAVVLWLYAMFLNQKFEEYTIAARCLEEAKSVCEEIQIKNDNYRKILFLLSETYNKLYHHTKDIRYIRMRDELKNKLHPYTSRRRY